MKSLTCDSRFDPLLHDCCPSPATIGHHLLLDVKILASIGQTILSLSLLFTHYSFGLFENLAMAIIAMVWTIISVLATIAVVWITRNNAFNRSKQTNSTNSQPTNTDTPCFTFPFSKIALILANIIAGIATCRGVFNFYSALQWFFSHPQRKNSYLAFFEIQGNLAQNSTLTWWPPSFLESTLILTFAASIYTFHLFQYRKGIDLLINRLHHPDSSSLFSPSRRVRSQSLPSFQRRRPPELAPAYSSGVITGPQTELPTLHHLPGLVPSAESQPQFSINISSQPLSSADREVASLLNYSPSPEHGNQKVSVNIFKAGLVSKVISDAFWAYSASAVIMPENPSIFIMVITLIVSARSRYITWYLNAIQHNHSTSAESPVFPEAMTPKPLNAHFLFVSGVIDTATMFVNAFISAWFVEEKIVNTLFSWTGYPQISSSVLFHIILTVVGGGMNIFLAHCEARLFWLFNIKTEVQYLTRTNYSQSAMATFAPTLKRSTQRDASPSVSPSPDV